MGISWIPRPFDYIEVDGPGGTKKLVLYPNQNCAGQLRDARDVRVDIVSKEFIGDLYIVTARASLPSGRSEESTGAVSVFEERGEWRTAQSGKRYFAGTGEWVPIRGTALANLLMKCETKAKRRATFALCGLGAWGDEPPDGREVEVSTQTGDVAESDAREGNMPNPPRAASPRYHTQQADEPADEAPKPEPAANGNGWPADPAEIPAWVREKAAAMPAISWSAEQKGKAAQNLAMALKRSAGFSDEDRADLYDAIAGVRSGKELDPRVVVVLLNSTAHAGDMMALVESNRGAETYDGDIPAEEEAPAGDGRLPL